MKSSKKQLKSRGFASDEDLLYYEKYSENELIQLLQDREPYKRTIAVKLLAEYNREEYIPLFCKTLKTENKLYTKIELCTILEKYNEKAVSYLIPLLGTIGKNQHKKNRNC